MAYKMYLDSVLMPITPSKVKVKINNQNETLTLISGEEINTRLACGPDFAIARSNGVTETRLLDFR